MGDRAQDAALEFDHGRIVRTAGRVVAEPLEGGAEDGDEPRGRIRHNMDGDARTEGWGLMGGALLFA